MNANGHEREGGQEGDMRVAHTRFDERPVPAEEYEGGERAGRLRTISGMCCRVVDKTKGQELSMREIREATRAARTFRKKKRGEGRD